MRGLLADSGRGRITGHDSIADAQRVGALQDQLHGEHVLGLGLAALDRDACAGVEVRVKHQAVAALAVEPGIHAILVFGNGPGNEVLGRRQVTEARRCADVLALQAVEQLLLGPADVRSEEHTSELQSLMRISYAVFCLKKKILSPHNHVTYHTHTALHHTSDSTSVYNYK